MAAKDTDDHVKDDEQESDISLDMSQAAVKKMIAEARERAYGLVDRIDWPGGFCRRDIGWREIAREG